MQTALRTISQAQGLAALAAVMSQFPAYLKPTTVRGVTTPPVSRPPEFVPAYGERQCPAIVWTTGPADWTRHAFVGWCNPVAYRMFIGQGMDEEQAVAMASRNRVAPPDGVTFEPIDDVAIALLPKEAATCDR